MNYTELANLLFPRVTLTPEDYETSYPPRILSEGAMVTRMAPSPTGFMHLGNLLAAVTAERLAHQSGGVFFLRIEDTDAKREVEGGVAAIIGAFSSFGLRFDEGALTDGESGAYGPYRQRQRAEIYHAFVKRLVSQGKAYPCFCTEEKLSAMRETQEAEKANFGYYGKWAKCRNLSLEEVKSKLDAGLPYVVRLKSEGDPERKIICHDLIKGRLELPENDIDHVLLKSDAIPTYHFAHAVDDHLMRTTHVVRGDEWLASLPLHLQLFDLLGLIPPHYLHIAPLMKMEGDAKRKLSKRKDPELAMDYYRAEGYPSACVLEYIFTVLNSNFEQWRRENPRADIDGFHFSPDKMSASGALFDLVKLRDVSKDTLAAMTAEEVLDGALAWAETFEPELFPLLASDRPYALRILSIGRGGDKPRKDLAVWKDVRPYLDFFYDELFAPDYDFPENVGLDDNLTILRNYKDLYDEADDQSIWFDKVRSLSERLGFAGQTKLYKMNPEAYKGHVGDVSMVLRVAVCGRRNSPDMHQVMSILGRQRVCERIDRAISVLEK